MTGLDPDTDTLLEVAVIVTDGDLNLVKMHSWALAYYDGFCADIDKYCIIKFKYHHFLGSCST